MNILEKILEEIEERRGSYSKYSKSKIGEKSEKEILERITELGYVEEIIRSHMGEVPNCGKCSRREWYQKGFEDGKKDNDWIPYTRQNTPKKKGIYLVTCDDEEYPVKRMRFKKEDEYGLWYDNYGIHDGVILAWQPLPEPYKKHRQ